MLQYVNGFSCALNEEKEEFILNFVQRFPKIKDGKMENETDVEVVSSLVMDMQIAKRLKNALGEMLEDEE